jgi:hypothetical protein
MISRIYYRCIFCGILFSEALLLVVKNRRVWVLVALKLVVKSKTGVVMHADAVRVSVVRPLKFKSKLKRLLNIKSQKSKYLMDMENFDQV